ncbi:MAG: hypothetical protein D3910_13260 [Candidatus Electrothrix sp. ATG2]|nr:hypothetical protein [Candidatus Electrothrix sp. ATG2]
MTVTRKKDYSQRIADGAKKAMKDTLHSPGLHKAGHDILHKAWENVGPQILDGLKRLVMGG